jgi:hypothetical protein
MSVLLDFVQRGERSSGTEGLQCSTIGSASLVGRSLLPEDSVWVLLTRDIRVVGWISMESRLLVWAGHCSIVGCKEAEVLFEMLA